VDALPPDNRIGGQASSEPTVPWMTRPIRRDNFLYGYLLSVVEAYCRPGMRVLDVGCGVGAISLYLAARGCDVLGIDVSEQAIASCRKSAEHIGLVGRVTFEAMDAASLQAAGPFDVVICFEAIEHMADDGVVLRRLRELVQPEGRLLISTPSPRSPVHRFRLRRHGKDAFDEAAGHLRRYTAEQLLALLSETGFAPLEVRFGDGLLRSVLTMSAVGRLVLRGVRSFLTPVFLAMDRSSLALFGEAQVIVVARPEGP